MIQLHPELIIFTSIFFAILFLQSGIDKAVDWKGNFEFHTKQFENSPLKKFTLPMLVTITIMEISCGCMSVLGIFFFVLKVSTRENFCPTSFFKVDLWAEKSGIYCRWFTISYADFKILPLKWS